MPKRTDLTMLFILERFRKIEHFLMASSGAEGLNELNQFLKTVQ